MATQYQFKNKRAQASTEFLLFFGLQLLIVLIISSSIIAYKSDIQKKQENTELRDFSISIQNEFLLAATMESGFSRTIQMPTNINKKSYTIEIIGQNIYVTQKDTEIILPIPQVTGNISKPTFTITKNQETIVVS